MIKYNDTVSSAIDGKPIYGAEVRVYVSDTNRTLEAQIYYDDAGISPATQPLLTDQLGYFSFFIADGRYDVEVKSASTDIVRTQLTMVDTRVLKSRALLAPVNENGGTIPSEPERAGKVFAWSTAAGAPPRALDISEVTGPTGPIGPPGSNAFGVDWSVHPALQRKLAAARAAPGTVTILYMGVGDSNGDGAGVGSDLAPVVLAMQEAQSHLDPTGDAIWRVINRSVPSTIVTEYFQIHAGSGETKTPAQWVEEEQPTVVVICYSANDPGVVAYNSSLGLDAERAGYVAMLEHISANGSDAIVMTTPHAHVGKYKALDQYGRSALMMYPGNPMTWPTRYFNVGNTAVVADQITFTFDNTTKRVTSSVPGIFTDPASGPGLTTGKKVRILTPNLGDFVNSGYYSVATVDPSGDFMTIDKEFNLNLVTLEWEDQGAPTFTNGSYAATIQRVDIDSETELEPPASKGWLNFPFGSGTVPALTRFLRVNEVRLQSVSEARAVSSALNFQPAWLSLVQANGEDRYYDEAETVHWNANTVNDPQGLRDAWRAYFRSLSELNAQAPRPLSQPDMVVRPNLLANASAADVAAMSAIDLQVRAGEDTIFRNSRGKVQSYVTDEFEPKRYERHFDPGYNVGFSPYHQARSFITTADYEELIIPDNCAFTIHIDAERAGIGDTEWRVDGKNKSGTVTLTATKLNETGNSGTIAISANGNAVRMTLFSPTAQTTINAYQWIRPMNYGDA